MKYLLENWNYIESQIGNKTICLFLDYDGTLSPIASNPEEATLTEDAREKLRTLSSFERCKIAIVSGRGIKDLKKKVSLENLSYSGNHGLEIETPSVNYKKSLPASYQEALRNLKGHLTSGLAGFEGTMVEDKDLTISVHYRCLDPERIIDFHEAFQQIVSMYEKDGIFEVKQGKMVLEIRPTIHWNKGNAVLRLMNDFYFTPTHHVPFYLGDDTTDEDAFKALADFGITVHVGNSKISEAKYFVNNVQEVLQFLDLLIGSLNKGYKK